MQTNHAFLTVAAVLVSMLSSIVYAQTEDSVIRGMAEATYQAGANEAPAVAIEEAKKLALRSFAEKIVGGYVIRRAQVQNTHLMASYVDFWSGAYVRVDSVLVSRYWTEGAGGGIAYHAYFSGQVSIAASEIERFKGVIAGIEREVTIKLREKVLATESAPHREDSAPISRFDPSELRVELERRAILARMTAEKLRLESMAAEEERKAQEAQARQDREEQIARENQAVARRLAALQDSVALMRSKAQTPASSLASPLAALREMRRIDAQIKEVKSRYRGELQRAILMVSQSVNPRFQSVASARKSEFEADAEFDNRLTKMRQTAEAEQTRRFSEEHARIEGAYEESITPFVAALKRLSSQQFRITWQDLRLILGTYNPQFNTYPVSIQVKEPMDGMAVLCSADISLPREEAQVLKQRFEHDILRPELVGNFQTTQFFRVAAAYVIDDATNKQYDLFSSKFVDLGNGIVYDSVTRLLWTKDANLFGDSMTWEDAKKACGNLGIVGLSGWRLPTDRELIRMYPVAYNQEPHPFTFINYLVGGTNSMPYWTMVLDKEEGLVFTVDFRSRRTGSYRADYQFRVWPVRGGQ